MQIDYTTLIVGGAIFIIFILIYNHFKNKKNQLLEQQLKEIDYDWGSKEIRKHTKKDLLDLANHFPKFKRTLYYGMYDKRGKITNRMELSNKDYLFKYIRPLGNIMWFPASIITLDLFGKKEIWYASEDDISFENLKEVHFKEKEITSVYDVLTFIDRDASRKISKLNEFIFSKGYEEVTGRLQYLPAKIAQLDIKHTQELAINRERNEALAKMAGGFGDTKKY